MKTRQAVDTLGSQARRVLELGIQGFSDKEIAARLGMSPSTVRTHFARLCQKYDAANRCQLAHVATRLALVKPSHADGTSARPRVA